MPPPRTELDFSPSLRLRLIRVEDLGYKVLPLFALSISSIISKLSIDRYNCGLTSPLFVVVRISHFLHSVRDALLREIFVCFQLEIYWIQPQLLADEMGVFSQLLLCAQVLKDEFELSLSRTSVLAVGTLGG